MNIGAVGGSTTSGDFTVQEGAASTILTANAITTAGGQIVAQNTHGDLTVDGALNSGGGNILAYTWDLEHAPHDADAERRCRCGHR